MVAIVRSASVGIRWRRRAGAAAATAIAVAFLARESRAQDVQPAPRAAAVGRAVLDGAVSDTGRSPLAGVTITADGTGSVVTDSSGRFRLAALPAGTVRFTARRVGVAPASFDVVMRPDTTVYVAIRMGRNATVLGTVMVNGKAPDARLLAEGYYDRHRAARGAFISPEHVERRRMTHASMLLREVPSVSFRSGIAGQTVAVARGPQGYCALDVWVDGFFTPLMASLSFDDLVTMDHLKAIEVYRSWREVPQRFRRPFGDCGAVVVWTTAGDG
jgi:hypothetical protein